MSIFLSFPTPKQGNNGGVTVLIVKFAGDVLWESRPGTVIGGVGRTKTDTHELRTGFP